MFFVERTERPIKDAWKDPLMTWMYTNSTPLALIEPRFAAKRTVVETHRLRADLFEHRYQNLLNLPAGVTDDDVFTLFRESYDYVKRVQANRIMRNVHDRACSPSVIDKAMTTWVCDNRDRFEVFFADHKLYEPTTKRAFWLELENNDVHIPPLVTFEQALCGIPYYLWHTQKDAVVQFDKKAA